MTFIAVKAGFPRGILLQELEDIFGFIIELDKLKGVLRKTRPIGLQRYENSAEHSWHVCMAAIMLREYANEPVDIDRVIKMLLIHDIGEIDAGDTIVYSAETPQVKAEEEAGLRRVLGLLSEAVAQEYIDLWLEFEAGESADARYAKSIDRIPPLLHNLHGDGLSWKENAISEQRVLNLNSRIKDGSSAVWDSLESKLKDAFSKGLLS
ncbi:HD domain-containing protein [Congregibacter litoralis]|uniref:Putative hydrolase of HD superfamily n=1 Tax=Congregibacter litoralis KT71 TaxID=314285 RepID=A4A8G9_9GAMM|nr:HD domain-containing protein [Congregibacter litoralis]EAQ97964.1 putative hydrolase of HD superfamily [Congregibacter litoralis KT71]